MRSRLQHGGVGKGKLSRFPASTSNSADRGHSRIPAYGFGLQDEPPYQPSARIRLIRLTRLDAMVFGPLVVFAAVAGAALTLFWSLGGFR